MTTYAVMDAYTAINVLEAPDGYDTDPTWIPLTAEQLDQGVWVGWSTFDGGATWNPPEAS
jgi:hypothetical protein